MSTRTRRQSRRITVESPADIITAAAIDHNKDVTQQQHFPYKLYDMLEYAADSEYSSSVSWSEDGMSFAINNKDTFMECIVPLFFKQTKFRSFTRQLNLWSFSRDTNSGEWQHKDFIRGRVERLQYIERVENKSKATSSSATNAQQLRQTFNHIINTRSKRHKKHVNYSEDNEVSTQEEDSNNTINMSPLRKISYVEENEDTPEDYNSIPSLLPFVESTCPVEYHSTNSNIVSTSGYTFEEYPLRYSLLTDETDILYKMATVVMRPD